MKNIHYIYHDICIFVHLNYINMLNACIVTSSVAPLKNHTTNHSAPRPFSPKYMFISIDHMIKRWLINITWPTA